MSTSEKLQLNAAFIFPGQGAQAVGMGADLYEKSEAARLVFRKVDEALGRELSTVMFEGPEEELRETKNAQPGIFAVSIACMAALEENLQGSRMPVPIMTAGHSLGEYTALVASGVADVMEAVLLVEKRGELMQEACDTNPGTMAAVLGMEEERLAEIVNATGAYISNVNTGDQIVISGSLESVEQAMVMAAERGAKRVIPLKVGGAFHSGLMKPAQSGLIEALEKANLHKGNIPIVANCTAQPISTADEIRKELSDQIVGCVQWKKSIQFMIKSGVTDFYEIGPGRALSGMVKKIDRSVEVHSLADMEGVEFLAARS